MINAHSLSFILLQILTRLSNEALIIESPSWLSPELLRSHFVSVTIGTSSVIPISRSDLYWPRDFQHFMSSPVFVLANTVFSGEQCSMGSSQMRWRAAPLIELRQEFGAQRQNIFGLLQMLRHNLAIELT